MPARGARVQRAPRRVASGRFPAAVYLTFAVRVATELLPEWSIASTRSVTDKRLRAPIAPEITIAGAFASAGVPAPPVGVPEPVPAITGPAESQATDRGLTAAVRPAGRLYRRCEQA